MEEDGQDRRSVPPHVLGRAHPLQERHAQVGRRGSPGEMVRYKVCNLAVLYILLI